MASSRLSSLKEADKRNPTKGRARTRLAAPSHPSSEGTSVVHKLIQGVGSITSVIQLKESVQAFRHQRVASNMGLPQSTKEIWNRLDLLENNTHTNNILHRLFLVQLDLRRKELNVSMKGIVKKVPSWVIDRIAKDAEEGDRTKVISRLHAGVVWSTISDEFSTGVLALIPTQKAHWPSNTAVEKLNQKDLAGFLNKAKNDRYSLIKGAAQRVTRLIPLFEGKGCEAMLKMEQVGVEVLQHIQNESDILQFLDCL
ncbi:hypothetical protein A1O3_00327 [Capronia epimyces CBS 606.96]|uniref:Uncharacterized protein n=1 Tax=Capronia epimyces CBS 606.96 TaxID=1182542 RepID=W9YFW2_9EURO|nr:uncharacterized protein A1O3_00327 [Capronia epimyces CBS 606.96]EXJ91777.1 hypothetical protein A1O3_00327 [Capronia epimyces CBS 606.96]